MTEQTRIRVKDDYYAPKLRGVEGTVIQRFGGELNIVLAKLDGYSPRGIGPNKDERTFVSSDYEVI